MTEDQELEKELIFKRFPEEKQEQVRGLVSYATLMGLTGKDLVSIGQKLVRMDVAHEKRSNSARIADFVCHPVDRNGRELDIDSAFKLKTARGSYTFEQRGGLRWVVTSSKTRVKKTHSIHNRDAGFAGRSSGWYTSSYLHRRQQVLLDIADGHLVLDF